MSLECMVEVLNRYPADAPVGEKLLAIVLSNNAHHDGTHIYPSVEYMAERSNQGVRTVQGHLATMMARDFLRLRKRGGGRGRAAEYLINPEWLARKAELRAPANAGASEKGADSAGFIAGKKGAKHSIKTPQQTAQNPATFAASIEPLLTVIGNNPPTPQGGATVDKSTEQDPGGDAPAAEQPTAGTAVASDPLFEQLMGVYPSTRADRKRAAMMWQAIREDREERGAGWPELAGEILDAARRLANSGQAQQHEGQYVRKLSTWLRNGEWEQWRLARAPIATPAPTPAPVPASAEVIAAGKERLRQLREEIARNQAARSLERVLQDEGRAVARAGQERAQ